jgi:hypothetical protein
MLILKWVRTFTIMLSAAVGMLVFAGATSAQATPQTARDRADDWIRQRGWREGRNPDGTIVAIGTAPSDPTGTRPELARALSFELACLEARNELATYLSAEIVSESASRLTTQQGPASSAIGRLTHGETPILSSDFREAVWVSARCELSALLPDASFESPKQSGPGLIAVVLRHDPASAATARTLATGAASLPISSAPAIEALLASLTVDPDEQPLGVRVLRDERGSPVLAAFGRSDVRDEPVAVARAQERSRIAAEAALRNFIGQVHAGQSMLEHASSLTELADGRARFSSAESFKRWLTTEAGAAALPPGIKARAWSAPASGPSRYAGVVLLVAPRTASLEVEAGEVKGSASGVGVFDARTPADRALGATLRRTRALRAAVVNAKGELARAALSIVAATITSQSTDARVEVREQIVVTVQRMLLSGAALVRAEYSETGEVTECRAWIEATANLHPKSDDLSVCGLPSFPTEREAAEVIAGWALRGLCDQAMVRVIVTKGGSRQLVDFGVGIGAGTNGPAVASAKALVGLAAAVGETIEGMTSLNRGMVIDDPLAASGGRMFLSEALLTERRRSVEGIVRIGGSSMVSGSDGVVAIACWRKTAD